MKAYYINVKKSAAKQYQPLTIAEFLEGATFAELQELESVLASHVWGAFVIVKRCVRFEESDPSLQVIVIDPDFMPCDVSAYTEDALAWHVAIKNAYKQKVSV